jgi:hypothetical protein
MTQPIRIFHGDDDAAARKRHEDIVKRLEEFGPEQVRAMMGHGFPTQWNPVIVAWLKGDKLEPEKPTPDESKAT